MVFMMPERESSASSEEFMLRVGRVTSAEDIAKMSGSLKERRVRNSSVTFVTLSACCSKIKKGDFP